MTIVSSGVRWDTATGINATKPPFTFDRLGVRVPFVAISPWIDSQVCLPFTGVVTVCYKMALWGRQW